MSDRKQIFILLPTRSPRTGRDLDFTMLEDLFDSIPEIVAWELCDNFNNVKLFLHAELDNKNLFMYNNFYKNEEIWE